MRTNFTYLYFITGINCHLLRQNQILTTPVLTLTFPRNGMAFANPRRIQNTSHDEMSYI